jgi:hypothetical protein
MSGLSLRRGCRIGFAIGVFCAMATVAHAVPITYTLSGTASGSLGGTPFTNEAFFVTAVGDTANVRSIGPGVPCNDLTNVTFTIGGVDSGYITSPLSIAANTGSQLVALALGSCNDAGLIWISGYDAGFGSYGLASGIGPVALGSPSAQSGVDPNTWSGVLAIASAPAMAFRATIGASVVPAVGLWWNPGESGSGYNLDVKNNVLVVTVYSYNANGDPQWYIASGPIVSNSFSGTMNKYFGGQCISCAYKGLPTSAGNGGVIGIDFASTTSATVFLPGGRVTQIQPQAF